MNVNVRVLTVLGMLLLTGVVASGVSIWLAQKTEALLQRTLISSQQLSLVTQLDAALSRERFFPHRPGSPVLDPHAPSSSALFEALVQSLDRELATVADSPEFDEEQDEYGVIAELDRRCTQWRRSGSDADWQALVALTTQYQAEEREEVEATTRQIAELRERVGGFVLLLIALPIGLSLWLLWQILRQQQILQGEVAARTTELRAKTRELREIDQNRRLFLAKLGHELRTPLTVLNVEAELAAAPEADGARVKDALTRISVHAQLISRRLSDLLALSRSEAGELVLERAPTELLPVVQRAVSLTLGYGDSQGVSVTLEDRGLGDSELLADSEWLTQALMALIDNAIKASPKGATVVVRAEAVAGTATVAVLDSGSGVDDQSVAKLTEAFFQSQPGATATEPSSKRGMGLGLSVANWVAMEHGGQLAFENRTEGGFCVGLSLPLT